MRFGRRREEDTQSSLEVGGCATGVAPTQLNAVGEHEGAGPRIEHVLGCRVHLPCHQLEMQMLPVIW